MARIEDFRSDYEFSEFVKELLEAKEDEGEYISLRVTWTTGGQQGGSCWDEGESNHYPVDAEPEPEDLALEAILASVAPDLTYLEFRKLNRADIHLRTDESYSEYYGNWTSREGRELLLPNLLKVLQDIYAARS